jgi:hypothetical protein
MADEKFDGEGPFDEALHVRPNEGEVRIEGPDGIKGGLTPRAALQSAHRLEEAAQKSARGTRAAWRLRSSGGNGS